MCLSYVLVSELERRSAENEISQLTIKCRKIWRCEVM